MSLEQEILNRVILSHSANGSNYLMAAGLDSAAALKMAYRQKVTLRDVDPEVVLERATQQGIRFVVPWMPEWPLRITELAHLQPRSDVAGEPPGLWLRGTPDLNEVTRTSVAVTGSRSSTAYGVTIAGEIGAGLARADQTVVSGGAFGIDMAAMRGARAERGLVIGVLATGVDKAYPSAHQQFFEHIVESGGLLVSEYAPGMAPSRTQFLARNRIIAALTRGTVVVEAAVRSGAMNAAGWAHDLGRPVFGVPGPVTSACSAGVHDLIKSGRAQLVTSAEDVLENLNKEGARA